MHPMGYCLLFKNDTGDSYWSDELEFKMKDMKLEGGLTDTKITVELHPGQE